MRLGCCLVCELHPCCCLSCGFWGSLQFTIYSVNTPPIISAGGHLACSCVVTVENLRCGDRSPPHHSFHM